MCNKLDCKLLCLFVVHLDIFVVSSNTAMLRNNSTKKKKKQKGGTAKLIKRRILAFPFLNALAKTLVSLKKLYTAKFLQSNCPVWGVQETSMRCLREVA